MEYIYPLWITGAVSLPEYYRSLFRGWVGGVLFLRTGVTTKSRNTIPTLQTKANQQWFPRANTQTCFSHHLSGQAVHVDMARMEEVKSRLSARQFR